MALESIVEKLITPKIEEFAKWCKGKYDEYLIPTAEHFKEYLNRTYEKYRIVNTLVFHNSQRELKEIYVAQSLVKENFSDGKEEATKINGIPVELIKKYKKILITDTAGMGKSTIMKRMFIDLIDRGVQDVGIPIYIELNRLNKEHTILQEIHEELNSLSREFDNELYLKLIQTGGFIFFLDGYDEISIHDAKAVTVDIQSFISKASKGNYFFLTSRPESKLYSFGDFLSFKIAPLDKNDAYELLAKYDMSQNKRVSTALIGLLKIRNRDSVSIDEYLDNPLLVSLLYNAYDYKQTIPLLKYRFYEQVVEALFQIHDFSKLMNAREKKSGLDYNDFDRVMRFIGFKCITSIGVKFTKDTIVKVIDEAKAFCGELSFVTNDLLNDLRLSVPLFRKDGLEYYKWAHISLMEYFAARFIFYDAKENQDKILTAIYKSDNFDKYYNLLDLYHDIDPKGFSKNIMLPFCREFIEFHDASVLPSGIREDLIEERISGIFVLKTAFLVSLNDVQSEANARSLFKKTDSVFDRIILLSKIQHNNNIVVFYTRAKPTKNYRMVQLLSRKKSVIVAKIRGGYYAHRKLEEECLPSAIRKYEHNRVFIIDSSIGDQSNELYNGLNMMIIQYFDELIDYEACKKEAEKIRKEIARSKDPFNLLINGI